MVKRMHSPHSKCSDAISIEPYGTCRAGAISPPQKKRESRREPKNVIDVIINQTQVKYKLHKTHGDSREMSLSTRQTSRQAAGGMSYSIIYYVTTVSGRHHAGTDVIHHAGRREGRQEERTMVEPLARAKRTNHEAHCYHTHNARMAACVSMRAQRCSRYGTSRRFITHKLLPLASLSAFPFLSLA